MQYLIKQSGKDVYLKSHEVKTVVSNDLLRSEKEVKKFSFATSTDKRHAKRFDVYEMAEMIKREMNLHNNVGVKWVIENLG